MSSHSLRWPLSESIPLSDALRHLGWATPSKPEDPLAGTPYRALERLGRGGMGEVFEAEHIGLGKRVVVKLLHGHLARRDDLIDRMRLEGQALARLGHPNIVEVFDIGMTPERRPFLVMERLYGRTLLCELSSRGALSANMAVEIGCQALAGLGAAHEVGLVHRDVKLDNIFLCDAAEGATRRVKIIDFGVAKVVAESAHAPAPLKVGTDESVALGTPRFFAPEQVRGAPVDARTDVYAMGVVLYALLVGKGPFDGLNELRELCHAHLSIMPPPPSSVSPAPVSAELDRVVLKAMAKQPEDRFPSARSFATALMQARAATCARWPRTEPMAPLRVPPSPCWPKRGDTSV